MRRSYGCTRRSTRSCRLPERPIDQPFLMPIEDVFSISGPRPRW